MSAPSAAAPAGAPGAIAGVPSEASDIRAIPSVPESAISETLAARLPRAMPAPWATSGCGLVWLYRAPAGAASHHQRGLVFERSVPLGIAAFLRYEQGPVGSYDELIAMPTVLIRKRRLSLAVPFIAVDSEASIAGGRSNWALPKTLAEFDWEQRDGLPQRISARGEGWSAAARTVWLGPRLPLWARARQTQVRADGSLAVVPVRSRGVGRIARVEVQSSGPTLPAWLTSGVHFGVAIERVTHRILAAS